MEAMHSLLKRQLKRHFGDQVDIPAEWRAFLDGVNEAYQASDADRAVLERSLELSSQEMLDANSEMRAVFEVIPDLVFRLNQQGVILDVKAGAAGDLMSQREALIGKRIQDTPLKDVAHQFSVAVQRVVAENAPVIIEYSAAVRGQESHYEARLVPIPNRQIVVIIHNITERKQSLRLLGSAVEQTTESIIITDAELDLPGPRILFVNPAFTKMTGYTADEVLGKTPRILQGPKSDRDVLRRLRETLARGETFAGETVNYHKDGTEFQVEWQVAPIRNSSGKTTHFVGIQRNITERKQAEAALQESEARYHALFDGSADGIVIADSKTKVFKYANPALCRMLGYTEAELQNLGVLDIHPKESAQHVMAEFEAVARGDKTCCTNPCLRKDGSIFYADINATTVTIDGRPCNVGFFRDITERKQAEEKLRQSEERFRQFANQSSEVIWFTELNPERILFINRMVETVWGLPPERFYQDARAWTAAIHPEDRSRVHAAWEACLQGRSPRFEAEYRVVRPDGSIRWVLDGGMPICNEAGEIVRLSGVARDITERKQAEEALTRLAAIVESSDDSIIGKNLDGVITSWNHGAEKLFGYTAGEMIGTSIRRLIPVDRQEEEKHILERIKHGESVRSFETVRQTKDGNLLDVSITASPIKDAAGQVIGVSKVARDITGRKRMEAELAYERDLLRTLLDQSPDKIYFKDAQSRFIKASQTMACQFKVASPDELTGKTDFDFFTEAHARPAFEDEQEIIRTGIPMIGKVELEVWQDGRETWALTSKMPFRNRDGEIIGTFGVSKDITALKQTEIALTHERDLFKILMDQFPDSIYFKDLQSRFQRLSKSKVARAFAMELARQAAARPGGDKEGRPAHLASLERFAEYLLGKTDFDLFAEAHARPAFEDEQEIIRTGIPILGKVEQEVWLDGHETWALTSKMPWRDQDGKIIGTFGVSKDITAMKQAEEQLRQLSRAVEQSPACIVITDLAGNITYVNPKFTAVTGYTFAEAVGKNPRILKSGETRPETYTELWKTITSGKEWRGEFHNRRKNGELYWETALISPIFDAAGKITHFLAVKEDTTERKFMEVRLFQSQKMETVGKLAGGIAHEFNSILTAIIGQSELLCEDLPAGSPLAKNAANITVAAGRAATLTRQLLAYGRKQFLRPEILDLNQIITSMDEVLRHLMGGETTGVNIVPAPGLHAVRADAGQIEQVIINLAMNAHDAMPNGGKLTLETANISFDQDSVGRYPELKPGNYVMLAISDTGVGMSAEVKAHVFEPFFTTKSVGQGTGLGLSTCYGIVKQSGGHISVYSEPGRGTTFKIYLPQAESSEKAPVRPPIPPHLPNGIETILLVEDDPALREMVAALLRRLGYTVLAAANGIEALSLSHQPATGRIDLLFTDVVMPHMNGKELADRVRVLYPHTRILFTSAYTEHAIVHQGMLDQGMVLLQKPFTPTALAHKVREVLDAPSAPKTGEARNTSGSADGTDQATPPGS